MNHEPSISEKLENASFNVKVKNQESEGIKHFEKTGKFADLSSNLKVEYETHNL